MLQLGLFKNSNVKLPDFVDLELFKVFRDYDEDGKGFLEPSEFYKCLESYKPLNLLPREITTLTLLCDCEMNQRIDYAMIMTFFRDLVQQMNFSLQLQQRYDDEMRLERLAAGQEHQQQE